MIPYITIKGGRDVRRWGVRHIHFVSPGSSQSLFFFGILAIPLNNLFSLSFFCAQNSHRCSSCHPLVLLHLPQAPPLHHSHVTLCSTMDEPVTGTIATPSKSVLKLSPFTTQPTISMPINPFTFPFRTAPIPRNNTVTQSRLTGTKNTALSRSFWGYTSERTTLS